jgi:GrpB-like predicted nucleotidyltransferase (UPF0157 family)
MAVEASGGLRFETMGSDLKRHPSLDDRFDPAVRIVPYDSPDHHFFAKPPERPRSHHLHVWEAGGRHELRHLAVRDYLRGHDEEAARYAALKRAAVARHPEDRLAYMASKEAYMADLEARALAEL